MQGQKIPFNKSLNQFATRKVIDHINATGKALPCSVVTVSGSIVTVKFEVESGFTLPQVTIPHFGGEWIRYPVQVGDKGVTIPMDARLNAISGIGDNVTADLSQPASLTALVFMPVGNANWSATDDPSKLELYGQNGVIIKSSLSGATKIIVTASGVEIFGNVTVHGDVTADGISLKTHKHGGVQSGGSQTGTPV